VPILRFRSYDAFSATTVNNKIYAIGGFYGSTANEAYDPLTDAWTTKTAMPTERWAHAAAVVNNKTYVIGGWNGSLLANNEEAELPMSDITFYVHRKD
jgi:N-acetylneuraminic acid mutarotase